MLYVYHFTFNWINHDKIIIIITLIPIVEIRKPKFEKLSNLSKV